MTTHPQIVSPSAELVRLQKWIAAKEKVTPLLIRNCEQLSDARKYSNQLHANLLKK